MKPNIDNIADLEAAFEAVKGVLFGPLDPVLVKLKHKEIIIEAKEKREQEFFTLGGRSAASDDHAERGRKDRDTQTRTLTWLLANNAAYAQLHAKALDTWRDTEGAADKALSEIEAALDNARIEQQKLLERAPLVGGKRVFRDDDGSVWTEDDARLPDEIAAGLQWKGDEPSRKEFKAGKGRIDELVRSADKIRGIQVEVADLGAELNDDKNPPSEGRTQEIGGELESYGRKVDEELNVARSKSYVSVEMPVTPAATSVAQLAVPDIP